MELVLVPDWERIESFIGFGRIDAPVVFLGMEEGLKDASALDEDLRIRSQYEKPVMDLKLAHKGIAGAERYFDPERAPRQPTWRVMADLLLRRAGNAHPTGIERRYYRALHLGREDGDSLLTELLPYPHPKASDWLYGRFGRYPTRESYERAMLPIRRSLLEGVLAQFPRELIVCYGKAHWPNYKALFKEAKWQVAGPYLVGNWGTAKVVLTTHFSDRGFNTDAQLETFAKICLDPGSAM